MQIIPSGGAWTNPAALTQQALGDSKHSVALKNNAPSTETVNPLEQSGKASDRDADERYDAPQQQRNSSNTSKADPVNEAENLLSLPANDNLEASTLDLLG